MLNRTVKSVKTYQYKGLWFLDIRYLIEDANSIKECHIPKARFPIEYANLIRDYSTGLNQDQLCLPDSELPLYESTAEFEVNGRVEEYPGVHLAYKTISEKIKEMTIEEIEKKLGHKIKIVNKKED